MARRSSGGTNFGEAALRQFNVASTSGLGHWSFGTHLDVRLDLPECARVPFGGVLVSTGSMRQRRHAEDVTLASLKIVAKLKS